METSKMNTQLLKMKKELKDLADTIRNGKSGRKPKFRTNSNYKDWNNLEYNRYHFRHKHIVYCMIRGRTMDQIEQPARNNLPNKNYIEKLIVSYNETICSSEKRLTA